MKNSYIPLAWLRMAGTWTAQRMIMLREEVKRRGVDENDIDAVRVVWMEIIQAKSPPRREC